MLSQVVVCQRAHGILCRRLRRTPLGGGVRALPYLVACSFGVITRARERQARVLAKDQPPLFAGDAVS
jgi:hypothetical protein